MYANILNIKFEPVLLETTLDGSPFLFQKGNMLITGTNKKLKRKTQFDVLTKSDLLVMSVLFRNRYHHYGYEPPTSPLADLIYYKRNTLGEAELNEYMTSIQRLGGSPLADAMGDKKSKINLADMIKQALLVPSLEVLS